MKSNRSDSLNSVPPPHSLEEAKSRGMTRKEFLRTASAGALLAFFGISMSACSENPTGGDDDGGGENNGGNDGTPGLAIDGDLITIEKGSEAADNINDGGEFYNITDASVMLINIDGSTIRAFTNVCTHQQCTTNWSYGDNLTCGCHGSQFDESGNVVSGPATTPLTEYVVTQDDNTITVDKSQTAKMVI